MSKVGTTDFYECPMTLWIDEILPPHLCNVCFIPTFAIFLRLPLWTFTYFFFHIVADNYFLFLIFSFIISYFLISYLLYFLLLTSFFLFCIYELSEGQVSRRENEPSRTITVRICPSVYFSLTWDCCRLSNILKLEIFLHLKAFPGCNFLLCSISSPNFLHLSLSLLHLPASATCFIPISFTQQC